MKIINHLLICCFCFVRAFLGPAACKFDPSCGVYTINMLRTKPLLPALKAIATQVSRCHPWG